MNNPRAVGAHIADRPLTTSGVSGTFGRRAPDPSENRRAPSAHAREAARPGRDPRRARDRSGARSQIATRRRDAPSRTPRTSAPTPPSGRLADSHSLPAWEYLGVV